MQFRIRNLLFMTFVIALCGGLMRLSLAAGGLASIPIMVALIRTMRRGNSPENAESPYLFITFFHSLALIIGLSVVTLLWVFAANSTVVLMIAGVATRICRWLVRIFQPAQLRTRLAAGLLCVCRLVTRILDASYAGAMFLTVRFVRRLNHANRILYTRWSH